jgi:cell division protein FtsW
MAPRSSRARKPPVEYTLLYTATLCLFAAGAVMVYSASSAESLLGGTGDPSYFLKRYLAFGLIGLVALHVLSRHGLSVIRAATPVLLVVGFGLTVAVMVPGIGVNVNGATRWLGAGPVQFQPSELLKVALVLYAAQLLAARPSAVGSVRGLVRPLLIVAGLACALLMKQPDMGTTLVICSALACLLAAAGARVRDLVKIGGVLVFLVTALALVEPYRRERLTAFLDPWSDASGSGFQSVQAMIAIGSGGPFGVGLGESVQKIFYLPEAHTDMILAIIGEELGLVGMADRALRADRLRRAAHGAGRARPPREAARGGDHVADPLPGGAELLRRDGARAADRRAAAVHLLRQLEHGRAAREHGAAAERRGDGRAGAAAAVARRREETRCRES